MILYLPDYKGGHFLDCTSQHVSIGLSTPLGLEERDILVLNPEEPRFVSTGTQQVGENEIRSNKRVEIVENALHVEETLHFNGSPAAYFRSYLATLQESQTLETFQALMSARTNNNLRLDEIDTQNVEEANKPLTVVLSYQIPRSVKQTARGLTLSSLPAIWEHYYLGVPFARDRQTPFKIRNVISFESQLRLVTPDGFRLSEEIFADVEESTGYHTYRHKRKFDEAEGLVTLSSSISQLATEGSQEQFEAFQNSSQDALALVNDSLELELIK